jgi:phosphatidylglycerophosphate synthase
LTGAVLAEPSWLRAAAAAPLQPGACRGLGGRVALCGSGASLKGAVAAAHQGGDTDILSLRSANWHAAERRLLQSLRKATDGFMARVFARPISLALSRRLARTGITPNMMTVVSLLIGLLAAPFFLSSIWWVQALGGLLFVAHSVIDGCDGEIARLKFIESRFGGLLDFWADNIVHVAVFACMGFGWSWAAGAAWPLWLAAMAVLGTAGSAIAVYWLTMRKKTGAGPVYTSVAGGEGGRLTRLLDELSRRDFIYLVFALSLFGKAAWFLVPAAIGAPVFFLLVLVTAWRSRRHRARG